MAREDVKEYEVCFVAQMFVVYISASLPVISLVVLNSWASFCILVVVVASMSSLQFVKRNWFHFEMKGLSFSQLLSMHATPSAETYVSEH